MVYSDEKLVACIVVVAWDVLDIWDTFENIRYSCTGDVRSRLRPGIVIFNTSFDGDKFFVSISACFSKRFTVLRIMNLFFHYVHDIFNTFQQN